MTEPLEPLELVDWAAAQAALARASARVSDLVRSLRDPGAPALGEWSAGDVATHVSHVLEVVGGLAAGDGISPLEDLWELPAMTTALVRADADRDMGALADRIDAGAAKALEVMSAACTDEERSWLVEGMRVPLSTLTCHLLNEVLVHGLDIARADGQRWAIDRGDAALVLTGFVFPVAGALGPALVDQEKAAGVRRCYDIHLRGGGRALFVFENGSLSVQRPSDRRVDCHLSADPEALLLVAWGRQSQWPAIARGKLLAWGRKPWLGVQLRGLMRNA